MPPVPDYYQELRIDPSNVTDEIVLTQYTQRVKEIRADLDLDLDKSRKDEEKALCAFEMLQCASSRKHVDQVLRTGKVDAALPCPHPLPWNEAIFSHSLSLSEKAKQEWSGEWTDKQQAQHTAFMESGGQLVKPRNISSETQFKELVRYNCSFNAFSILGMRQVDVRPDTIEAACKNTHLKEWRETSLGALSASAVQTFEECVQFAYRCLLSPRVMDYVHALQRGYFERVDQDITYRMPVTRTNICAALFEKEEDLQPAAKKAKTNPATPE